MNAYYNNNRTNNSNNEIFLDLLIGGKRTVPAWKRNADKLLALLAAMVAVLTGSVARRILRVVTFTAILLGLIAVVGAVEAGTLGIGTALLISLPLLALEYLCLRKQ